MDKFNKRIFTFFSFLKTFSKLFFSIPSMIMAKKRGLVSTTFQERIMVAVSAVNGCRYCSWFHTKLALKSGSDMSQIESLMTMELGGNIPEEELVALAFSQHYAETDKNPDEEVLKNFNDHYGKRKAKDIMLFIHAIYFGNLSGNTFDAFLERLKGKAAPKSNPVFELFFFIVSAPILLPSIRAVERYEKKNAKILGKHVTRS